MDTYNVGNGPQQISLAVDISTIGLAATRATVGKPNTQPVTVATSKDVTGDIPTTDIGSANSLNGGTLVIATLIDLRIIGDETARKKEYERIGGTYTLNKGLDGLKNYPKPDSKVHADEYKTVVLVKQFKLS